PKVTERAAKSAVRLDLGVFAQQVRLLYATDRQRAEPGASEAFTGERGDGTLTYGAATIQVPEKHRFGHLEQPFHFRLWRLEIDAKANPAKHFLLEDVSVLDLEKWRWIIEKNGPADVLLFVHGFNTSFKAASLQFAQVAYDLNTRAIPILFS